VPGRDRRAFERAPDARDEVNPGDAGGKKDRKPGKGKCGHLAASPSAQLCHGASRSLGVRAGLRVPPIDDRMSRDK